MEPRVDNLRAETRRWFLERCGVGLGGIALASLLGAEPKTLQNGLETRRGPHFRARAKRVLYLHMAGAPSHLDLFDDKPKLRELSGQPVSESVIKGERFAFIKGTPKVLGSPHKFARHGQSGQLLRSEEHTSELQSHSDLV